MEPAVKEVWTDCLEHSHRGYVVGAGQRRPQADQAMITAVVVLRPVMPLQTRVLNGRIIDERGRREPIFQSQAVRERLESGSGLAQSQGAIGLDILGLVEEITRPNQAQDLAAAVV